MGKRQAEYFCSVVPTAWRLRSKPNYVAHRCRYVDCGRVGFAAPGQRVQINGCRHSRFGLGDAVAVVATPIALVMRAIKVACSCKRRRMLLNAAYSLPLPNWWSRLSAWWRGEKLPDFGDVSAKFRAKCVHESEL